ncbi:FAD-dependent oxidoreductase [Deinococcus sp. KSM4-11]|uniref:NAD(P)/FAD-dependent oxidoreductase n=1 Tax=Deinococcus sp. KSM4-11 TaxID=2568654 RepID=UPI0010A44226|nr:NAD(P)/FAD-dependent oxidoreductase [Deinococcus sp. KSM4-11]THF86255.1 FAD-dependent oxidoreductase [Deinococcus sp. KSM4-11]
MLDVLVIGGGLAGLTAARTLARAGRRVQVIEAGAEAGGRVRSRVLDGFTLDAGYQVLFPAYPAVKRQLNLGALDLVPIAPAAVIRRGERADVLGDPIRDPAALFSTLTTRVLPLTDKLLVAKLAAALRLSPPHRLLTGPDETTEAYLRRQGFGDVALDAFFRPFFGGIFLDRSLGTSARLFRYYFRMLMDGGAALPRAGMGVLTAQLAQKLDITLSTRVTHLTPHGEHVTTATTAGELDAKQVIVATDPDTTQALTGEPTSRGSVGSTYLHYATAERIDPEVRLILNAEDGFINNAQWLSTAIPGRAPAGQHQLTVTVLGLPELDDAALDAHVRGELGRWYGPSADSLRPLLIERIRHAQYPQPPAYAASLPGHATGLPGVLIAGEVTAMSGIQGALESGEKAAAIILGDLNGMSRPRGA